jgi:lia operon protein LiaG
MKTIFRLSIFLMLLATLTPFEAFAQMKTLVDVTKSYNGISKIEVSGGALEIEYVGSPKSEVSVSAFLESNNHDQDIVFVTVGNVLKITHKTSSTKVTIGNTRTKGHVKIQGPEQMELDFKGGSGKINVENVSAAQTILSVGSGNLSARNINGDIRANAGSGSIKLSGVNGNIKGNIGSGSANIQDVKGNLEYASSSGGLTATSIDGVVHISLTSGNVKLESVTELGDLKLTSGNLNATNAGLGAATRINGTSGNFKIQTPSDLRDFNFNLIATSGNITVGNSKSGRNLSIDNGSEKSVKGSITSGNISIVNQNQ